MLFPIIRVKDKDTGNVHIVGTNSHDTIEINEMGALYYRDLQCLETTGKGETYEFIPKEMEEWDVYPCIEFVTFEDLIEIYKEQTKELCESEKAMIEMVKKFREDCIKENDLDEDNGIRNTAGNLI